MLAYTGMTIRTPLRALTHLTLGSVLVAVWGGGCSFAFVDGPPTMHRQLPYFECTSGNGLPTVDLVLGALTGIEAAALFESGSSYSTGSNTEAAVAAGEAALFAASAIYGYGKTSSCREAKAELMQRLPRGPVPGPGFGPGPMGRPPVPYDPWVSPPPGAFAAPPPPPPPQTAPAPPPPARGGPAPTSPPTSNSPPASDDEIPKKGH